MSAARGFQVHGEAVDGTLRLSAVGELDLTGEQPLVAAIEASLSRNPPGTVVVDLAAVEFIDSSGLRALLRAQRAAEQAGVQFALAGINDAVTRVLELSGVTDRFRYE